MAEIKNSFLLSKMNKDLDDRLVPNGEYRDALNISIGKSENDDVGTLQNVLGNIKIPGAEELVGSEEFGFSGLTCIGFYMDNEHNRIYRFLTNYTDPNPSEITLCETLPYSPDGGWAMKITVYDFNTATYSTLVEGTFLNFSTTNIITGLNLLEGLLYWTDNRNQPRKINYNNCINNPNYYTTETQISVAKYAPVESPLLYIEVKTFATANQPSPLVVDVDSTEGLVVGMTLVSPGLITGGENITILSVDSGASQITLYSAPTNPIVLDQPLIFLISTMSNQENNPAWPGDPAYLESKYVRFSYRFKFDDNEYSILAPFSQIAFIPNQKGYFINGDEQAAYRSTILKWMENNTNNVELLIPMPDTGNNINSTYKIKSIDILYKESNSLAIKVLDSVDYNTIKQAFPDTNIYIYSYQSQKPYKTLAEDQITRVYDKVPTRALAQEISGNRVIYGNFYTTYTPPSAINYNVSVLPKSDIFPSFIEYPNHTLKQNRNYQVGFVLADKFGRQSSVILSTIDLLKLQGIYGGSTIYSAYRPNNEVLPTVKEWFGNALTLLVNDTIKSTRNIPLGTPGLYAEQRGAGFAVSAGVVTDNVYVYTLDTSLPTNPDDNPQLGDYLRGKYTDYVEVTSISPPGTVTTDGAISDIYNYTVQEEGVLDLKFSYTLNQIGWYSYKVLVKQKEQDYYNVYLPGILDGYPAGQTSGSQVVYVSEDDATPTLPVGTPSLQNAINMTNFPNNETGKTSHMVLINDNINKVPRDLAEVGPDQKQYRSSVELFGRVENRPKLISFVSLPNLDNANATSIRYDLTTPEGEDILNNVKTGDGLQSVEAQFSNFKWYKNTTVVSNAFLEYSTITNMPGSFTPTGSTTINIIPPLYGDVPATGDLISLVVSGTEYNYEVASYTTGVVTLVSAVAGADIPNATTLVFTNPNIGMIVFTPANPINSSWDNFTATAAENNQYFPLRKADVVNTIAYATDLDFLQNSVNNITGSADLNFYQLQTNPLVGRISTSKSMGTLAEYMIPTLGVYETRPVESLLDLFWETASTGLISDLNWDINTGYDGPAGTTPLGFDFYEWQDPEGIGEDTGAEDSPYITDAFNILNNTNVPLDPTVCVLTSVFNYEIPAVDFTDSFALQTFLPSILNPNLSYRIKIINNFEFLNSALTGTKFLFTLTVTSGGITNNIPLIGQLKNKAPYFTLTDHDYDRTITVDTIDIVTVEATNGSFRDNPLTLPIAPVRTNGLYWTIVSGNELGYFDINPSTGVLSLINHSAQLGVYPLNIKVQDAVNFATTPPSTLVTPGDVNLSTKQDTVNVIITIGEEPINGFLEYWNNSFEALGTMPEPPAPFESSEGYFGVYVGTILPTDPNYVTSLPTPPGGAWTNTPKNVQYDSGALGGIYPSPTGLTNGELRFKWTLPRIYASGHGNRYRADLLIYYRANTTSAWGLVQDNNGVGITDAPYWDQNVAPRPNALYVIPPTTSSVPSGLTSTATGVIRVSTPGEYCFAIKVTSYQQQSVFAVVEDANFYYEQQDNGPSYPATYINPFIPRERFMVGLIEPTYDDPSGVPYNSATPDDGFVFTINTTVDTVTDVNNFSIDPVAGSDQMVPGMWLQKVGNPTIVKVFGVTGNDIALVPPGLALAPGDQVTFRQQQPYGTGSVREMGNIWASSKDATFVKQFYLAGELVDLWNPPIADKFYNFKSHVKANPQISPVQPIPYLYTPNAKVTAYAAAQIDDNGAIIDQTLPAYTISMSDVTDIPAYGSAPGFVTIAQKNLPFPFEDESPVWFYSGVRVEITGVTTNTITVGNVIPGYNLTWAEDCTTPTLDYFPSQTETNFPLAPSYTITGLNPNTTYYILMYPDNLNGYVNGEFFPVAVTTLPV